MLMLIMMFLLIPVCLIAADVDIFAEGAYTDTLLDVYIYADINTTNLLSYGIKLTYDPQHLKVKAAKKDYSTKSAPYSKNKLHWYIGNEKNKNNPLVDATSNKSAVLFIGGICDPSKPKAGISNSKKVFLGKVSFTLLTGAKKPLSKAVLALTYARGTGLESDTFKNFVKYNIDSDQTNNNSQPGITIDGTGVDFDITTPDTLDTQGSLSIYQRGDANADGRIDVLDAKETFSIWQKKKSKYCYADCNNDGKINRKDVRCVKKLWKTKQY